MQSLPQPPPPLPLPPPPPHRFLFSSRFCLCAMMLLGIAVCYTQRVSLSIALVAMVEKENDKNKKNNNNNYTSSGENSTGNGNLFNATETIGEFDWSSRTQGSILASFFYGYIFTQLPGGFLSQKFGGKRVFGSSVFLSSLLTLVTPFAARLDWRWLWALRFLEGLAQV